MPINAQWANNMSRNMGSDSHSNWCVKYIMNDLLTEQGP